MTTAKKPAARRRKKRAPAKSTTLTAQDVWARTQMLVEVLLEVMEGEIRAEGNKRSERWLKLFGEKDSAVVNLQKLVQLLAELQSQAPPMEPVAPVDAGEMAILAEWLAATNAASVSTGEG